MRKGKHKLGKILSDLFTLAAVLLMAWIMCSVIEIGIKNKSENPQYSQYNAVMLWADSLRGGKYHDYIRTCKADA